MNPKLVCDMQVHGKSSEQEKQELCEREKVFLNVTHTLLAAKTWVTANPKPSNNNFF
jgi:hypothetical protein